MGNNAPLSGAPHMAIFVSLTHGQTLARCLRSTLYRSPCDDSAAPYRSLANSRSWPIGAGQATVQSVRSVTASCRTTIRSPLLRLLLPANGVA
jgi:hypothetical protein